MKHVANIIAVVAVVVLAFYVGRHTAPAPPPCVQRDTVWRVYRDTIVRRDTLRLPQPYAVVRDSVIWRTVPIDTAALLADYYAQRHYVLDFSNDTVGVFRVDATVQRNTLTQAVATVQPLVRERTITEQRTVERRPLVQGYAQVGASLDLDVQKFSAGVDLRQRFMVGASALHVGHQWGYTVDVGIKF